MKRLREEKTQSRLSFLCDVSREYLRCLERGSKKPSFMNVINIIKASGLDIKETLCMFVDMLEEEHEKIKNSPARQYIINAKAMGKKKGMHQGFGFTQKQPPFNSVTPINNQKQNPQK